MKTNSIIILFATLLFVSCGSSTQIVNSWRDPNVAINSGKLHKFMVAALLKNQTVRRQVEDQMASFMPGKAIQSYKEFGPDQLKENDDALNQKLKSEGFDGVVVMSLASVDTTARYVPGTYPAYYGTWRGYYRYSWTGFYNPGYYTTDKTYNVEVNVYSLISDKLIWSGNSSTINPAGRSEMFNDVSKAVYKKMQKEGFLQ